TMGFALDMTASSNVEGDPPLTLYQYTDPEPFTSPATRAAQNPLFNKVVLYHMNDVSFTFYVKFSLTNRWSNGLSTASFPAAVLYGVLATPTAPMAEPWTQVLEDTCDWAKGTTDAT